MLSTPAGVGSMAAGIRSLAKGGRFVSTGYTDQQMEIHQIEFILPESSFISTVAATRPSRMASRSGVSLGSISRVVTPLKLPFP